MNQDATAPIWKQAFPDFDGMTFEMPEGFEDNSWRHDACPSFVSAELAVQLYVNYADPSRREVPGANRFVLFETKDGDTVGGDVLLATEDFGEVLTALEDRRASLSPKMG